MALKDSVSRLLQNDLIALEESAGCIFAEVPKDKIVSCLSSLRDELGFNFLSDIVGVDNSALYEAKAKKAKKKKDKEGEENETPEPERPALPRFEVIYLLLNPDTNERLQVRIRVPEDDLKVQSITSLWKGANWPERECFDMFGIRFEGHPYLRRLLMWDEFPAHPLRKDYPLEGMGEERHLIYEPEGEGHWT